MSGKGQDQQRGKERDAEKGAQEAAASAGSAHSTASSNTIDKSVYPWYTTAGFGARLPQEAAEQEAEKDRIRELLSQQAADEEELRFRTAKHNRAGKSIAASAKAAKAEMEAIKAERRR